VALGILLGGHPTCQRKENSIMLLLLRKADRIIDYICLIFSGFGSLLMALLTIVVFAEVISRYFFSFPFAFTTELTTIFFPWMVFVMTVEVTRNRDHLAITVFRRMFPIQIRRIMVLSSSLVMLMFSVCMVWSAVELTVASWNITLAVLQFMTKAYLYGSLVVSFTFVSFVIIVNFLKLLVGEDTINDQGVAEGSPI
jgi:TRAP-type transport system small permease protein